MPILMTCWVYAGDAMDNAAARKFNEHVGFQEFDIPATYDDGIHLRMVLNLEESVRRLRAEETLT